MYSDVPAWAAAGLLISGLVLLAWSSDVFVDGASSLAKALGVSPFVIGMVVIGFGTSAPELCVSALSGLSGHSSLSLGNAYGSCIFNIAAILGAAALIRPLATKPSTVWAAAPLLTAISVASWFIVRDGTCSRTEAWTLLAVFAAVLPLYCFFDNKAQSRSGDAGSAAGGPVLRPLARLAIGLAVLVGSSHCLVWGAVDVAKALHVSDLAIGLTIVAAGTSLPELASAIASARRGETDLVMGNIVGSNLFNALAVVGIACVIEPAANCPRSLWMRDIPAMAALSLSITLFGLNRRRLSEKGRIGRLVGTLWLASFAAYTAALLWCGSK